MMGDSAGRSADNPIGQGARRRNTERERAQIDAPFDERDKRVLDQARSIRLLRMILAIVTIGFVGYMLVDLFG